jgi:hypothetical protein
MNQKQPPQQQGQKRILAVDDEPDLNKLYKIFACTTSIIFCCTMQQPFKPKQIKF